MQSSSTASSSASVGEGAETPVNRRAAWRFVAVFAVVVLALLGAAEWLLRAYVVPIVDGRANRVHVVYTDPRVDAVIGDSHLYRAFMNSTDFANLARGGSSPHALEIVAREYYRHRKPGRVIVEASPQLFNPKSQTRRDQQHAQFFTQNFLPTGSGFDFRLYVFEPGIGRELAEIWDLAALERKAAIARGRTRTNGRVVEKEAAHRLAMTREEHEEQTRQRVASNRPVRDLARSEGFASYRRMIELLKRQGAQLCMARTPVTELFLAQSADDPNYSRARNAMQSLARELAIPYVDFLDLNLALRTVSFTNPDHLTTAAGMRYADRLIAACYSERSDSSTR